MRFLHIADLHLGIQLYEFSMLEEQRHMLEQILKMVRTYRIDAVLIAGDVYDRSVPGVEAVKLLDWFLAQLPCPACVIAGNHDSAERLQFGAGFMEKQKLYIQGTLKKPLFHADFKDRYGVVEVWMLPFVRPETARSLGYSGTSYQEAVDYMLEDLPEAGENRRILMAHQYVVSDETASKDQEDLSIGGVDQIRVSSFRGFDYVALGHIHGASRVGDMPVCYSGSPLKYSFSEATQVKCAVLVELGKKGELKLSELPLEPLHDWREIRGPLELLTAPETVAGADPEDYIRAVLTDDTVFDALGKLRSVYPNLMRIDFDNARTRGSGAAGMETLPDIQSLDKLFGCFYEEQCGKELAEEDAELIRGLLAGKEENT